MEKEEDSSPAPVPSEPAKDPDADKASPDEESADADHNKATCCPPVTSSSNTLKRSFDVAFLVSGPEHRGSAFSKYTAGAVVNNNDEKDDPKGARTGMGAASGEIEENHRKRLGIAHHVTREQLEDKR